MARIRVGLVGATVTAGGSGWGANAHIPALQALSDDYEIRAVCTAHPDTAEASREAFGAEMAFHDFDAMLARSDIDLITVVVRVPWHHDLVMKALQAGKHVFCEWPLGATLAEAGEMAQLAAARSLRTAVGLQARSDPALMYARELIGEGYVGEVTQVQFSSIAQAITERGEGRIWQAHRVNGANTLTIAAGHAIDGLCFVLGEFQEVTARLATKFDKWHNPETGETVQVDSPDWVSVSGRLENGAEVAFLVTTVASNPDGVRWEVYGRSGALAITAPSSLNNGPSSVSGSQGKQPFAPMPVPERFNLVDEACASSARNVAQEYARFAAAAADEHRYSPDFDDAVQRHRLIAAIEQSAAEARAVLLPR